MGELLPTVVSRCSIGISHTSVRVTACGMCSPVWPASMRVGGWVGERKARVCLCCVRAFCECVRACVQLEMRASVCGEWCVRGVCMLVCACVFAMHAAHRCLPRPASHWITVWVAAGGHHWGVLHRTVAQRSHALALQHTHHKTAVPW